MDTWLPIQYKVTMHNGKTTRGEERERAVATTRARCDRSPNTHHTLFQYSRKSQTLKLNKHSELVEENNQLIK